MALAPNPIDPVHLKEISREFTMRKDIKVLRCPLFLMSIADFKFPVYSFTKSEISHSMLTTKSVISYGCLLLSPRRAWAFVEFKPSSHDPNKVKILNIGWARKTRRATRLIEAATKLVLSFLREYELRWFVIEPMDFFAVWCHQKNGSNANQEDYFVSFDNGKVHYSDAQTFLNEVCKFVP